MIKPKTVSVDAKLPVAVVSSLLRVKYCLRYIYMLEVDLWRLVFIFVRDGLGVSCCYNKAAGKQGEHLCTSPIPYNKSLLNQEISIS